MKLDYFFQIEQPKIWAAEKRFLHAPITLQGYEID